MSSPLGHAHIHTSSTHLPFPTQDALPAAEHSHMHPFGNGNRSWVLEALVHSQPKKHSPAAKSTYK